MLALVLKRSGTCQNTASLQSQEDRLLTVTSHSRFSGHSGGDEDDFSTGQSLLEA